MFRTLVIQEGRAPVWVEGVAGVEAPAEGARMWVDLEAPTEGDLTLLRERFGLDPIALEDCARVDLRPKLEEYDQHLFIVLHRLIADPALPSEIFGVELHAFLGDDYLLTIHDAPMPEVEAIRSRLALEGNQRSRSLAHTFSLICERLVSCNFAALDHLFDSIEAIEDSVLKQEDDDALPELFAAKRQLAAARRLVVPQREVVAQLLETGPRFIDERSHLFMRRVLDLLIRMSESIDTQRDILSNVLDAHLSMVSNRTNAIMKSLTLLSAIFLPLSFVTGFFGQNFEHLPFNSGVMMAVGMALCVLIPAAMMFWFKSRKWL